PTGAEHGNTAALRAEGDGLADDLLGAFAVRRPVVLPVAPALADAPQFANVPHLLQVQRGPGQKLVQPVEHTSLALPDVYFGRKGRGGEDVPVAGALTKKAGDREQHPVAREC